MHFFDHDVYFKKSIDYSQYVNCFEKKQTAIIKGEATPIYMYWNPCMQRIYDYNKDIKLIVILRNPIDRAFSHWNMEVDRNNETKDFLYCIKNEKLRLNSSIDEIKRIEAECGNQIYTKKRAIFGEQIEISTREGHAISNLSKALKHIRNALVHSSDKYKRDECHIPLTSTEHTIEEYIPIIKYLAEQIIYGTATPNLK